ncbi:uncharacterized protein PRCAT00005106001 [Priceomyces carsonii]|uniref:uncharacterized protein n=1 Tax=Priceomyces carsonii TaxID=28549 RepID=UPI002ED81F8F|nr:unnamed protein product [Priceomyces carsonii]
MNRWKLVLGVSSIPSISFIAWNLYLTKQCPEVEPGEMPADMRIMSVIKSNTNPNVSVPYCDIFKIKLQKSNFLDVSKSFFDRKALEFDDNGAFKIFGNTSLTDSKKKTQSTVWRWKWSDDHLVKFFEKLASWGYPFRLMNGGYHELYVETDSKEDAIEVYFANAHEYADLGDSKILPKWVRSLHRVYARYLLSSAFEDMPKLTSD